MAWNATFPTQATRISQSVQQIQDNWAFLQTNINTDHYFNSGAPNEGHHRVVQYINQGADPAVAVDGVLYTKVGAGGRTQPYFRNSTDVRSISTYINGTTVIAVAGTNNLVNLAGRAPFVGFVTMYRVGGTAIKGCAFVVWDTFNARVTTLVADGSITAIGESGTNITVTSGAYTIEWQIINMQNIS